MTTEDHRSHYRIGAVARLTGIPPDTLRVWERRYDLVKPLRSEGGGRLYSQEDVTRLGLIKRLVDNGQAIGTIAELTLEQLQQRIAETQLVDRVPTLERPVRLVILGPTLYQRLQRDLEADEGETVELVGNYMSDKELLDAAEALDADVLVVEMPVVDGAAANEIQDLGRRCGVARILVVYGFASRQAVGQLERLGVAGLRFPVAWDEIRALVSLGCMGPRPPLSGPSEEPGLTDEPPARLYDDRQLARASAVATAIKCECPRHLSDIIASLCHFEAYSAHCEHENRDDAALHAYLHLITAKARHLMERALKKAVEVEGIDLDRDPPQDPPERA